MKKNIMFLALFVLLTILIGLMKYSSRERVKTFNDRLSDSFILDSLMNQYFRQEDVKDVSFFNMGVYMLDDSLHIGIFPVLQKNDTFKILPNDMLTYKGKKIFVYSKNTDYLPREKNSETIKMYKQIVDNLPVYFNTDKKKYHIWYIQIKDNTCKIEAPNYIHVWNDPKKKFIPPPFKPIPDSANSK